MMPGEELMATGGIAVADSGPAAKDAAFSEPFGKAPEPLYELPLGPHTEHMAKGVAAALRSLMRSYADPDGWLPPLLDEERCATISRRAARFSLCCPLVGCAPLCVLTSSVPAQAPARAGWRGPAHLHLLGRRPLHAPRHSPRPAALRGTLPPASLALFRRGHFGSD